MKIGIITSHFSFPSINYLINNSLVAGFAVPEMQSPGAQNIKLLSKTFNLQFNILQKKTLLEDISFWLSDIEADVVFIFSFPYKIPEKVLGIPALGFINFHPSILPSYRGPDPLFWQIINGIPETGITAYKLDKNIDAGPIIHFEKEIIEPADTYGCLSKKLADTLLRNVIKVTSMIKDDNTFTLQYINQDEKMSSYFGMPKKEDLMIDWGKQTAISIYNLVRASNPKYQGAISFYKNYPVRILQVSIEQGINVEEEPGTIIDSSNKIKVAAIDGRIISIDIIHVNEGYYTADIFRNLFKVKPGDKFERN